MAYQRRKRRFDRKKVVLVERTICILILLALLALAGRWIAGQLSKEDLQTKKLTKTQTDNTAQKEDKTETENTQTSVYDFVCSDGTLSAEFQQTLSDRAKEDKKVQKILADSRNYPVSMLELLAKNAETTDFVADYLEKKDEAPAESIGEVKEGETPGKSLRSRMYFTWISSPALWSIRSLLVCNTSMTPDPTVPYPITAIFTIFAFLPVLFSASVLLFRVFRST